MLDVNGQSIGDGTLELVKFAETASAVNEITVTNSATGNAPEIASSGDDTNIDLKLTPKGTGKLNLDGIKFPNADGSANQVLKTDGSGNLSFTTLTSDGTADWDTSVKTTGFTATANKGYFCNTTSAAFTVTLPATPSAGDEVIILDYAGTFDTNKLTISPNGGKIEGATDNVLLSGEREGARLVYIDSTQGWLAYSGINEGTDALSPTTYSVDFLVIAGGGGGGARWHGGGGGAGGYRNSYSTETSGGGGSSEASLTFNVGTVYTVTVGGGGAGGVPENKGTNGVDSSISGTGISTITSTGGGGGGHYNSTGLAGGSGGGAGGDAGATAGGNGTANQGFKGGGNSGTVNGSGGGGGGAGAVGQSTTSDYTGTGGTGGAGLSSSITGSSVGRAGGGGGGATTVGTATDGGGSGYNNGTVNTGGGGSGGNNSAPAAGENGKAGGKGVVILRMPTVNYSNTTTGSPTVSTSGADTILVYNDSGSYTG
jgi:hypothetical protein